MACAAKRRLRVKEKEFNLLDEPWIRVMTDDCSVKDVSLTDALLHAHE